jgi:hypothetical protein
MASVKQFQVTFDCAEPERVARFWCEVLGYVVPPPPEGFATWGDYDRSLPPEDQGTWFACVDPSGTGPRLFFQRVPEGKVVKNRVHLDVRVGTGLVGEERLAVLQAECARLVALGAVRVRVQEPLLRLSARLIGESRSAGVQVALVRRAGRQLGGPQVGVPGRVQVTGHLQQVGPDGVQPVRGRDPLVRADVLQQVEADSRAVHHGGGHGVV